MFYSVKEQKQKEIEQSPRRHRHISRFVRNPKDIQFAVTKE